MPVVISTQKQMQDRRRGLTDCYICGTALPDKKPGWRSRVIGEHVVARAWLGDPPSKLSMAWTVVLDVHKECDETHKQHRDHMVKVLQALGTQSQKWSDKDRGLLLRRFDVTTEERSTGEPGYAINGCDVIRYTGALLARGMHAALYGEVLPEEMKFVSHPPVPIWNQEDEMDKGLQEHAQRQEILLGLLRVANHVGNVDQIVAWGGKLVYQCAWRSAQLKRGGEWGCTWALEYPGVHEWAMKSFGVDAPWHGYYETDRLPTGCAVIGRKEIDQFNEHVNASAAE